jgi:hypothetical protein
MYIPLGTADIFYPTCFHHLQNTFEHLTGARGHVLKQRDFALRYAEVEKTRTLTGYNALVDDYSNMSIFISRLHATAATSATRATRRA